MSTHTVERFSEVMNDEASRQHDYEVNCEVRAMNRLAKQHGGVTHTSSLRADEGDRKQGTGNKGTVAPPDYYYRDPGSDLIDVIIAVNWRIRQALNVYPEAKPLLDALQITTGLGMESTSTILKTIPHLRALAPDYTPDREWIMEALDCLQTYAEEEQKYSTIGLGIAAKV